MFKPCVKISVLFALISLVTACGSSTTSIPTIATVVPSPTKMQTDVPPTNAPKPVFEKADCAFDIPEGFQAQCGYLIVPEDRSQPDRRNIRLHVAIFKSSNLNPAPDPVIHLIGGPGASALNNVQPILMKGGTEILKQRDYILFDQRGTQYSAPYLYCLPYDEYLWDSSEQDVSLAERNTGALQKLATCLDDWQNQGIDLAAYNSAENASDVNDLRMALGYEQVNLYGISYGTRLALNVIRDHPESIRSVIIDSVYPPQANLDLEIAANANRSLQEVFQTCAADDFCASEYGDIEAKFYEVIDRLKDSPVQIETYGPYRGQPYLVDLDGDLFIDVIFGALYSMVSIAYIPQIIQGAYKGSYTDLSEPVGSAIGSPVSTGLFWSTICVEEIPFEIDAPEAPELASIPSILREHFSEQYTLEVCNLWDVPAADPKENEAVNSDIPTLIFSGRYDPVTPPRYSRLTADTLSHSYYYEFQTLSHGVMRSNLCALQMGLAFFDDPLHAPDSACMNELESVEFR